MDASTADRCPIRRRKLVVALVGVGVTCRWLRNRFPARIDVFHDNANAEARQRTASSSLAAEARALALTAKQVNDVQSTYGTVLVGTAHQLADAGTRGPAWFLPIPKHLL
eukprot:TRINITY_DN3291_c0_g1_i5.p6 TRINITY_DN3291_c0_g1~~TRINITY_DN3291_c0_g1_i5.p6  ORF type:complete len:110 (+),score=0.42 TRINITY_DN3291_c0_g1_i5:813-1142(+)